MAEISGDGNQLKERIRRMAEQDAERLHSGHGQLLSGATTIKTNFEQPEKIWSGYIKKVPKQPNKPNKPNQRYKLNQPPSFRPAPWRPARRG